MAVRIPLRRLARLRRSAGRCARDTRGATIIEFALVAAPFIALLMGSLQTSLIYFGQEALETAVEAAARSIITGTAQASDQTGVGQGMTSAQLQARFKQNACNALPTFMSCSNLLVDVESAQSWSGINTAMPTITYDGNGKPNNQLGYNMGAAGSIAMVRLIYIWPVEMAPGLNLANAGSGRRTVVATSVAKVESFS